MKTQTISIVLCVFIFLFYFRPASPFIMKVFLAKAYTAEEVFTLVLLSSQCLFFLDHINPVSVVGLFLLCFFIIVRLPL